MKKLMVIRSLVFILVLCSMGVAGCQQWWNAPEVTAPEEPIPPDPEKATYFDNLFSFRKGANGDEEILKINLVVLSGPSEVFKKHGENRFKLDLKAIKSAPEEKALLEVLDETYHSILQASFIFRDKDCVDSQGVQTSSVSMVVTSGMLTEKFCIETGSPFGTYWRGNGDGYLGMTFFRGYLQ